LDISCGESTTNLVNDKADQKVDKSKDAQIPLDRNPEEGGTQPDSGRDATSPSSNDNLKRAKCNKKPCACDNGLDDDEDGLVDGLDTECTGSFDNDEASFATGIPVTTKKKCLDCFLNLLLVRIFFTRVIIVLV